MVFKVSNNAQILFFLGVGELIRNPSSGYITDLNNLNSGECCAASSTLTSNVPSDASTSDKAYFCFGTADGIMKIQVGGRGETIHTRIWLNGSWGNWVKI